MTVNSKSVTVSSKLMTVSSKSVTVSSKLVTVSSKSVTVISKSVTACSTLGDNNASCVLRAHNMNQGPPHSLVSEQRSRNCASKEQKTCHI